MSKWRAGYRLPEVLAEHLDALVEQGRYVTKSEALRAAVMAGLPHIDVNFDWSKTGLPHPADPGVKHDTTS